MTHFDDVVIEDLRAQLADRDARIKALEDAIRAYFANDGLSASSQVDKMDARYKIQALLKEANQ